MSEYPVETGSGFVISILGGGSRRGPWSPPARVVVLQVLGGATVDFREADLLDGVTNVYVFSLLGGVKIVVPPGLEVQVDGVGVLGGFAHRGRTPGDPDGPVLRVRGVSVLGGVSVR